MRAVAELITTTIILGAPIDAILYSVTAVRYQADGMPLMHYPVQYTGAIRNNYTTTTMTSTTKEGGGDFSSGIYRPFKGWIVDGRSLSRSGQVPLPSHFFLLVESGNNSVVPVPLIGKSQPIQDVFGSSYLFLERC